MPGTRDLHSGWFAYLLQSVPVEIRLSYHAFRVYLFHHTWHLLNPHLLFQTASPLGRKGTVNVSSETVNLKT